MFLFFLWAISGLAEKIVPQKEIRLSAEIEMVGEKRLEFLHIAVLDPKSRSSVRFKRLLSISPSAPIPSAYKLILML